MRTQAIKIGPQCVHVGLASPIVTYNDCWRKTEKETCELNICGYKSIVTFGFKLTTNCTENLIVDIGRSTVWVAQRGRYGLIISLHR